jgi:hypothetical protein
MKTSLFDEMFRLLRLKHVFLCLRTSMSKDEMVSKVFDRIIDIMGTLISHNG